MGLPQCVRPAPPLPEDTPDEYRFLASAAMPRRSHRGLTVTYFHSIHGIGTVAVLWGRSVPRVGTPSGGIEPCLGFLTSKAIVVYGSRPPRELSRGTLCDWLCNEAGVTFRLRGFRYTRKRHRPKAMVDVCTRMSHVNSSLVCLDVSRSFTHVLLVTLLCAYGSYRRCRIRSKTLQLRPGEKMRRRSCRLRSSRAHRKRRKLR
ncbi:hypothetical protein TGDOM2_400330, partial [Toxoplasma gondii GAB2-2007-GAL-DOM2]